MTTLITAAKETRCYGVVLKISSVPSASVRNTQIITGMSFSVEPKQFRAQLFEELITLDLLDKPPPSG